MGGNTNIGHLVMLGIMKQEEHGYSKHVKSSATGVSRPNVQTLRYWERKLVSAFNTVEVVGKRAGTFEGRLLESLGLMDDGTPGGAAFQRNSPELEYAGFNAVKNRKEKELKPKKEVFAAAEQSLLRMKDSLRKANAGLRIADRGAILPKDTGDVRLAKEVLFDLDIVLEGLAARVKELESHFGL